MRGLCVNMPNQSLDLTRLVGLRIRAFHLRSRAVPCAD